MLGAVVVDVNGVPTTVPETEVKETFSAENSGAFQTLVNAFTGVAPAVIQAKVDEATAKAAAKSAEAQARLAEAQAEKAKAGIPVLSVRGALPTWVIPIAVAAGAVAIFLVLRKK